MRTSALFGAKSTGFF